MAQEPEAIAHNNERMRMTTLNTTQISSLDNKLRHILSDTIGRTVRTTLGHRPQIQKAMPHTAPPASSDSVRLERMKTRSLDEALAAAERLSSTPWPDAALARIPNEELATMALNMSDPLRREFSSISQILAYWRALRR